MPNEFTVRLNPSDLAGETERKRLWRDLEKMLLRCGDVEYPSSYEYSEVALALYLLGESIDVADAVIECIKRQLERSDRPRVRSSVVTGDLANLRPLGISMNLSASVWHDVFCMHFHSEYAETCSSWNGFLGSYCGLRLLGITPTSNHDNCGRILEYVWLRFDKLIKEKNWVALAAHVADARLMDYGGYMLQKIRTKVDPYRDQLVCACEEVSVNTRSGDEISYAMLVKNLLISFAKEVVVPEGGGLELVY